MRRASVLIGMCAVALAACACKSSGETPEPRTAATEEGAAPPSEPGLQAGHELEVGVEFEEGEEAEEDAARTVDRAPPPTQAYSPASQLEEDETKPAP